MPLKSHTPHRTLHSPKLDLSFCPLSQFVVKDAKAPFIITPHKTFSRYAIHQYSEQLRLITANRIPKTTWNTLQFSHNSLTYIAALIALYRNKTPVALINQRTPPKKVSALIRHVLNSTTYIGKLKKNDLPPALTYLAEPALTKALTNIIKKTDLNESTDNKSPSPIRPLIPKPIPIPITSHLPLEIVFTSGTTSTPNKPSAKAVVYSLADLFKSAATSNDLLNFTAKKRWYLSLPLYHISGLSILFRTLIAGASLYLDESSHFSPRTVLTAIEKHAITHLSLVSAQLLELLTFPRAFAILKKCDVILIGGSFIPPSVWQLRKILPLYITYGMTETLSHIAIHYPSHYAKYPSRSPHPTDLHKDFKDVPPTPATPQLYTILPDKHIKIINKKICVAQNNLGRGYLKKDHSIAFPLDKENYFHTDDLGVINTKGLLRVIGRASNQITSGGETFQIEEIEYALTEFFSTHIPHPNHKKATPTIKTSLKTQTLSSQNPTFTPLHHLSLITTYVIAVEHAKWGEVPVALLGFIKTSTTPTHSPKNQPKYQLKDQSKNNRSPHSPNNKQSLYTPKENPDKLPPVYPVLSEVEITALKNFLTTKQRLKKALASTLESYKHPKAYYLLNPNLNSNKEENSMPPLNPTEKMSRPMLRQWVLEQKCFKLC
ncbi:2-succinylbenzoate--CoA ligase [Spirochaetota bacterium]|nr:2-succinylbenzoate--CoA ligase [Spirochaetota bacterium]